MASTGPHARFTELRFEDYQAMAHDSSLSANERSGFPESYRGGAEVAIVDDIVAKLPRLADEGATVADVGCGATPLTDAIGELCRRRHHELLLVDSPEVLSQLADATGVTKLAGRFPDVVESDGTWSRRCDAVIVYSVIQVTFFEGSTFRFFDALLGLLSPGGRALVADLPNHSMRRRFLAGEAGRVFHREYMQTDEEPDLAWPALPGDEPDDGALVGLLLRARAAGFHAWLVPQAAGLPMANRREDLLIERP